MKTTRRGFVGILAAFFAVPAAVVKAEASAQKRPCDLWHHPGIITEPRKYNFSVVRQTDTEILEAEYGSWDFSRIPDPKWPGFINPSPLVGNAVERA